MPNMVDRLSNRVAININKNAENASSVKVLEYALKNILNMIIVMFIVLFVCAFTGHIVEAIIAVFAFPLLRYFSGGLHFRSANLCNVISSLLILASVYMPIEYWYNGLVINILAAVILLITAPANVGRSKLDKRYYPVLKTIAVLIVFSNFFLQSHVLAMVFLLQALTTLGVLQKLLDRCKI